MEKKCTRQFGTGYHYIGGFYGACNEELMKIELVKNGPIAVSFEVYDDFRFYKGGIYHHTGEVSFHLSSIFHFVLCYMEHLRSVTNTTHLGKKLVHHR